MSTESLQDAEKVKTRRQVALEETAALAQSHVNAKRWREVVETTSVMLQWDPRNESALFAKAIALVSLKEVTERAQARDTLERLMQINPRNLPGAIELARVYLTTGSPHLARPLLARLATELPHNADVSAMQTEVNARLAEAIVVPEAQGAAAPPRRRRIKRARYPDQVSAFDDLRAAVKSYVIGPSEPSHRFLAPAARGFTMGSCFAGRIARELNRAGQPTFFMPLAETINTTHANLELLRWLAGEDDSYRAYFENEFTIRRVRREDAWSALGAADFIIYTLGVAPAFFHRETGRFRPHDTEDFRQFEFLRDHVYRTTTLDENLANLRSIHALLRKVRPDAKLVLTVSPVPLSATFEMESAIVADCVSKSTLRAAAHEFMRDAGPDVTYWPSFEIVRWLSGHIGRVFGTEDGSNHHVSDALVAMIVELFIERFRPAESQV